MESLLQIKAPHFVAGLTLIDDWVTEAAPIIRYMVSWKRGEVLEYVARKGWEVSICASKN